MERVMFRTRMVSVLLFAGIAGAVLYLGWLLVGPSRTPRLLEAKEVPHGDQEVAWFPLATEGATGERFVDGIKHARTVLGRTSPRIDLEVDDQNAFPKRGGEIPEVSLRIPGAAGRLWIRYYKLTSEANPHYW